MAKAREKPIRWLWWLPHLITCSSMASGLVAIVQASKGDFPGAVLAICFAAAFDFCDGKAARLTGNLSPKGGDLDSMVDFSVFGVATSIVVYFWALKDAPLPLLVMSVVFPWSAVYRLAKFNLMDRDPNASHLPHFLGVPTPAGAGIVLLPLIYSFLVGGDTSMRSPYFMAGLMMSVGLLEVSNIPTVSNKDKPGLVFVIMTALAIVLSSLLWWRLSFWLVMLVLGLCYLVSLPVYYGYHLRKVFNKVEKLPKTLRRLLRISSTDSSDLGSQQERSS